MFIAFEGIDGSGKTTLSKMLSETKGMVWTKEPTFSSGEADRLNLRTLDHEKREALFLMDRVGHQNFLREHEYVVCDRYLWGARAYSKVFSPEMHEFLCHAYDSEFFRKPDCFVFVDTPVEICTQRKQDQHPEHLRLLRQAYLDTWPERVMVVKLIAAGNPDEMFQELLSELSSFWSEFGTDNAVQQNLFT
jgi:thymidylate kinase